MAHRWGWPASCVVQFLVMVYVFGKRTYMFFLVNLTLCVCSYPSMTPKHKDTNTAGNDVFHKFSAYIKNQLSSQDSHVENNFLRSLVRLDKYLKTPLPYEEKMNPELKVSSRKFLDGDKLTLADCNLLPKLHIINIVCKHYRKFEIPAELMGLRRYLDNAAQLKDFTYTCPNEKEILLSYSSVVKPMNQ
ncbi:chloride intracellular channel 3 [Pelobates cultripes]|uniref:Chloride intracellular channel 3 n=1 Tax=Pelobates cultripes TaxID=61616 RepID=A0AAD1T2X0_PELCU|nr:chloride intracellular channel 3 [Pelobates cultripes]